MTNTPDSMPRLRLAAPDDDQSLRDADRDAALALRLKTWNPERETRVTKELDALLHWLQKPA